VECIKKCKKCKGEYIPSGEYASYTNCPKCEREHTIEFIKKNLSDEYIDSVLEKYKDE